MSDFLGSEYAIKIIDLGSSCFDTEKIYTYVQSRFYRSPEVIMGISYNMAIDMWSLGCILAELYTGYPLFPGENEQEQLWCIMEICGLPPAAFLDRSSRRRVFFDSTGQPRPFANSKGKRRRVGSKSLYTVLKCQDAAFLDFIERCLAWEPEKRMTPAEALRHGWIVGNFIPAPKTTTLVSSVAATVGSTSSSSTASSSTSSSARSGYGMVTASNAAPTAVGPYRTTRHTTATAAAPNPASSYRGATMTSSTTQLPPIHSNYTNANANAAAGGLYPMDPYHWTNSSGTSAATNKKSNLPAVSSTRGLGGLTAMHPPAPQHAHQQQSGWIGNGNGNSGKVNYSNKQAYSEDPFTASMTIRGYGKTSFQQQPQHQHQQQQQQRFAGMPSFGGAATEVLGSVKRAVKMGLGFGTGQQQQQQQHHGHNHMGRHHH